MKRLQKCCCCASTRTGTLIVAGLGIILSIATIVAIWVVENHFITFTFIFDEELKNNGTHVDIPRIILTINLVFTILISTLLIVAVLKRRSWLMLPWVVLGIVLVIGFLISVLHLSITYYIDYNLENHNIIATCILVIGLLYALIYLYLWAVVFSHYLDVRDEAERGRYSKAPYRR